jgi:hypothetical protein
MNVFYVRLDINLGIFDRFDIKLGNSASSF